MSLPDQLATWTGMMRTTIANAQVGLQPRTLNNVENALTNLAGMIVVTPAIEADMRGVAAATAEVRALLAQGWPDPSELALAKARAAGAVLVLEEGLKAARPNDVTTAIGLDW